MRLWLLRPIQGNRLWKPWYDKVNGFVIRANTEVEARAIAQDNAGDEIHEDYTNCGDAPAWTDARNSTCEFLDPEGEAEMVLRDFNAA